MSIAVLCVVALAATFLSWLYLSNRKELPALTQAVTEEEQPVVAVSLSEQPAPCIVWKKPTGRQLAFLIAMFVGLCATAVGLELIYERNTLLDNLKLITLLALLFTAANVDAKEQRIPNVLILAGLALRVAFWVAELIVVPNQFLAIVMDNLTACLMVGLFFLVGVLLIRGGLGMGDIKLMLVMCLFQGFYGVASALFCSLFVAFIYAVVVLITKKKSKSDAVAFAPAILLGTMLSVFLIGM